MSNSSPLKRKRERDEDETLKLTHFLNKFKKNELITSIIQTQSEELSEIANERKATIIKEAIKILTKEFADLDELILYLHLKYIFSQKSLRHWNILEIRNADLYRSSEKVSASMLKYFTKYNMKCKVYSKITGSCNWIVFRFSAHKSKPVFCVVHIKLSLIFISYLTSEYLSTTKKIIRKSYKGKEISDLGAIRANAEFIQNLNRNEWKPHSKKEDIKVKIINKETVIENKDENPGISQKQIKNKRKARSWKKERRALSFEDSENEVCLENNVPANVDPRMQLHDERFQPEQEERSGIKINTEKQTRNKKKKNSEKKDRRAEPFEENENEEYLENNVLANDPRRQFHDERFEQGQEETFGITNNYNKQVKNKRKKSREKKDRRVLPFAESENEEYLENNVLANNPGMQFHNERSEQEEEEAFGVANNSDKQIKNKRKRNRERKDRRAVLLEENATEECLESNAIANGDLGIQDERFVPEGEESFENNAQLDNVPGVQPEDERYQENQCPEENNELPIIKNLKYQVKSKEDEDDAFSFCIVKFRATNILKGLNKLIQLGIADNTLPDYLILEPKTEKTEFFINV